MTSLLTADPDYSDAKVNLQRLKERRRIEQLKSMENLTDESSSSTFADPLMLAFGDDEVQRTRPKPQSTGQIQSDLHGKLPPLKQQQVANDQLKLALQAVLEGRHHFALQLCSQAHQTMPMSSVLFECLSDAYIALQRFAEAEICLLHAIQLGARALNYMLTLRLCCAFGRILCWHIILNRHLQLMRATQLLTGFVLRLLNRIRAIILQLFALIRNGFAQN